MESEKGLYGAAVEFIPNKPVIAPKETKTGSDDISLTPEARESNEFRERIARTEGDFSIKNHLLDLAPEKLMQLDNALDQNGYKIEWLIKAESDDPKIIIRDIDDVLKGTNTKERADMAKKKFEEILE